MASTIESSRRKYDTVQLFVTCLVDAFYPQVGIAVVKLLEGLGFTVAFPAAQTCCGQPHFNSGLTGDARRMARHTVNTLAAVEGYIVLPSGSCTDMIVHHYEALFVDEPAYREQWAGVRERTFELTQFLVDELGITRLRASCPGRGTYHPSCHGLRNLGLRSQAPALLAEVDGLEMVELPEADICCGFGGLFAVKMSPISGAMLERKLDQVEATGADTLIGGDVSCLMHMAGGLQKRKRALQVRHIAEILAGEE